jgi:hypothetical protein
MTKMGQCPSRTQQVAHLVVPLYKHNLMKELFFERNVHKANDPIVLSK